MPILYRPSDAWADDAGYPDDHVLGEDDDVIAQDDDPVTVVLEWLFGPPLPQIRRFEKGVVTVRREVGVG